MRFSLRDAIFAIAVATFAGCSNSTPGSASLPSTGGETASHGNTHGGDQRKDLYSQYLKDQIDGKLPHYLPREALEAEYKASLRSAAPPRVQHSSERPAIWAISNRYLIGITRRGESVRAIPLSGSSPPCFDPTTVKVDHSQNVWVDCGFGPYGLGGTYKEFDASGSLTNTYTFQLPTLQCPPSAISCQNTGGFTQDGAQNGSDVFVSVTMITQYCVYNGSQQQCSNLQGGGFLWWPEGNPSSSPTFISLQNCCGSTPIGSVGFMDLDSNGNILFDYIGGSVDCSGSGVGEIENPTSASWSFVDLIPCTNSGPLSGPLGLYVGHSGGTSTLNITDDPSRLIYRWVLPFDPSGSYTTLGPTQKNVQGKGQPISGGFGPGDTHVVQGDGAGWVDSGRVANNKWKILWNKNLTGADPSAALTPSDK